MKRCPTCRRDYFDDSLLYCLDDGSALLEGPASSGEPATAVLSGEDSTRQWQPTTTDKSMSGASGGMSRKAVAIVAVGVLAAVVGVGYAVYVYRNKADTAPRSIKIDKLTTDGRAGSAAISPDGKDIVYSVDEGGAQSMWRRQVATSGSVQIVPPEEGVEYAGIRFTPDGDSITFGKRDKTSTLYTLYQMPALGGTQKKLIADVDSPISYSPDRKQFAFVRGNFPEMGHSAILVANADGSDERIVSRRQRPETFPWWFGANPVWSPDGGSIACVVGGAATGSGLMDVAEINVADGSIKSITKKGLYQITSVAWLPDKSGLLLVASEKGTDYWTKQIWQLSYPDGEARRITTDFNNYTGMDLAPDGRSIVAVQSNRVSNIWLAPNADARQAVQIRSGGNNQEGVDGLNQAPDGRIVFYSKAGGADDLWIMNSDGSGAKQLTDGGVNYDPLVTPDGRYIVFTSERTGHPTVWRMDLSGENPKQLTFASGEFNVTVTPDSRWVFYDTTVSGKPEIWKVSIEGGDPVRITQRFTENPEVSPDGKVFVSQMREDLVGSWRYGLFNIDGGEPLKVFDLPNGDGGFRWFPDGRAFSYVLNPKGIGNIWSIPIDGGQPKQLTDFKNDLIFNFRWAADKKSLILSRGTELADVVLIRDFR